MNGAALYRDKAIKAWDANRLLGRVELADVGLQKDYILDVCLLSIGFRLGDFGNRFNDLPVSVD